MYNITKLHNPVLMMCICSIPRVNNREESIKVMYLYCIKSYHVDPMTSALLSLKGISKQEQCLHKVLLRMQEDSLIVIYLSVSK